MCRSGTRLSTWLEMRSSSSTTWASSPHTCFGLSLGGMVASQLALEFTARVHSLVLASTIPEPEAVSVRGLRRIAVAVSLPVWAESGGGSRARARDFVARVPTSTPGTGQRNRAPRGPNPCNPRELGDLGTSGGSPLMLLEHLPRSVRTLLLFGELDLLAGVDARAELQRELPNAECEIIAGAGHDISLERPRSSLSEFWPSPCAAEGEPATELEARRSSTSPRLQRDAPFSRSSWMHWACYPTRLFSPKVLHSDVR